MGNSTESRTVSFSFGANPAIERGVLNGTIQATLRLRREAEPGDTARAHTLGLDLVIDNVIEGRISDFLKRWYRRLGFESPEAAQREWRMLHPHTDTSRRGYIYTFHHSSFPLRDSTSVKAPIHASV